jgi:hypothetical protein
MLRIIELRITYMRRLGVRKKKLRTIKLRLVSSLYPMLQPMRVFAEAAFASVFHP